MLDSTIEPIAGVDVATTTELLTEQDRIAGAETETATEQELVIVVDKLISEAIIEYTKSQYESESYHVEAHAILGGEEAIFEQLIQSDKEMVFYILVKEGIYGKIVSNVEGTHIEITEQVTEMSNLENAMQIKQMSGSSFPAKVTIGMAEDGSFQVTDFWVPRDGSFYEADIKEVFPEEYWEEAFFMEGYEEQLKEKLLEKAVKQLK